MANTHDEEQRRVRLLATIDFQNIESTIEYQQGYHAKPKWRNPYDMDTLQWALWESGYEQHALEA